MKFSVNFGTFLVAVICAFIDSSFSKKIITKENCEVCVSVIEKFEKVLTSRSDQALIREEFKTFCSKLKNHREDRFCYYIGGKQDSATNILNIMARPISLTMPSTSVCDKLYAADQQICDLKYEKKIDLVNANFRKMRVKELKKILSDWDDSCRGCAEKSDFIKRIEELMPEHDPEAHAARKMKQEL